MKQMIAMLALTAITVTSLGFTEASSEAAMRKHRRSHRAKITQVKGPKRGKSPIRGPKKAAEPSIIG